jgi:putative sigma-54 modulation protein
MEIIVQSPHFKLSSQLENYIQKKLSKLPHLYSRIEAIEVCLKLENSVKDDNKICQVKLIIPGNDLFVSRKCTTFEEAVDRGLEALTGQIEAFKSKMENGKSGSEWISS